MTVPRLIGLLIAAIAFLSGALLVAQAFVPQWQASSAVLALLFPSCLLCGLPLYTTGCGRTTALRLSAYALLTIGAAALLGLFADAAGLLTASRTLALWLIAPAALLGGLLLNHFAGALERLPDSSAD